MNREIRDEQGFTVVGISTRASNDDVEKIGKLWGAFVAGGGPSQIADRRSDEVYAVYFDYEGDHTKPYSLLIGCSVNEGAAVRTGQVAVRVPAGRYALFAERGPVPQTVVKLWMTIWSSPLQRTYVTDFEHYGPGPEIEIHVGVR